MRIGSWATAAPAPRTPTAASMTLYFIFCFLPVQAHARLRGTQGTLRGSHPSRTAASPAQSALLHGRISSRDAGVQGSTAAIVPGNDVCNHRGETAWIGHF